MVIRRDKPLIIEYEEDLDKAGLCRLYKVVGDYRIAYEPMILDVEKRITRSRNDHDQLTVQGRERLRKIRDTGIVAGLYIEDDLITLVITVRKLKDWGKIDKAARRIGPEVT